MAWCGWAKLNVLQKRWLVYRLAALLILRSVGILSSVFSTVVDGLHGRHSLAGNRVRQGNFTLAFPQNRAWTSRFTRLFMFLNPLTKIVMVAPISNRQRERGWQHVSIEDTNVSTCFAHSLALSRFYRMKLKIVVAIGLKAHPSFLKISFAKNS